MANLQRQGTDGGLSAGRDWGQEVGVAAGGSTGPGGGTIVSLITVGVTPSYTCAKITWRHACVHKYTHARARACLTGEVKTTIVVGTCVSLVGDRWLCKMLTLEEARAGGA